VIVPLVRVAISGYRCEMYEEGEAFVYTWVTPDGERRAGACMFDSSKPTARLVAFLQAYRCVNDLIWQLQAGKSQRGIH
jgi:hypothetical protein